MGFGDVMRTIVKIIVFSVFTIGTFPGFTSLLKEKVGPSVWIMWIVAVSVMALLVFVLGNIIWASGFELFSTNQLKSLKQFIRTTKITNHQEMYKYLNTIGDRFAKQGDQNEAIYGSQIKNFASWLSDNPGSADDFLNALNNLTGIPTETAQDIVNVYAKDNGLDIGATSVLINIIAYNIVRTRVEYISESFTSEEQVKLVNLVKTADIPNNEHLLALLKEVQDLYLRSSDPNDKEVAGLMSPLLIFLTMEPTSAIAIRNAMNYTCGNPPLAVETAIARYGNAAKVPSRDIQILKNAFLNEILKARQGPMPLNPALQNAAPVPSMAPTGLRETFSTAAKTQLTRLVKHAYIPDNRSAVGLLRKLATFYIENGSFDEKATGQEIMQVVQWLEKMPREQTLLREALTKPNSNPAFTMHSLVRQFVEFNNKSFEVENKLSGVLVFDLVQMRHGPRY